MRPTRRSSRSTRRRARRSSGGSTAGVDDQRRGARLPARTPPSPISICSASATSSTFRRLRRRRYKSAINGHVDRERQRDDAERNGRHRERASLTDSTILGGTIPQLDFDGSLVRRHRAREGRRAASPASIRRWRAAGRRCRAPSAGTLDVDATVANVSSGVTPDSVAGRREGRRSSRRPSAAWRSRAAALDADYHELDRRDPHARDRRPRRQRAGERHAGAERHRTVEPEVHADSPRLEEIGKLFDHADVRHRQGRRDGHRQPCRAAGDAATSARDGLKYERQRRADVSTDFTAKVPDLAVRATPTSRRTRTRPSSPSAGRTSTSSTAKTTYAQKQRRVRRYREAAAAIARRRRLAGAAPRSSGSASDSARSQTPGQQHWQMAPGIERRRSTTRADAVAVAELAAAERRPADRRGRHASASPATR